MRGASPEVGQETPQPDDNLRQSTGLPRVTSTTTVDNQGVLDRQKEREEHTTTCRVSLLARSAAICTRRRRN
ncbi:unnamed protein product [Pylaiella littoralis]